MAIDPTIPLIRRLTAVVEAVRRWGPYMPRRVIRALADLEPMSAGEVAQIRHAHTPEGSHD